MQYFSEVSINILIIMVISYIVGSFPTSIIMARKLAGIDIREHGSGNAGMSNIIRVIGWKPGLIVGMVDTIKGWTATAVIPIIILSTKENSLLGLIQVLAGSSAVLGHTYTIFSRFRGGKGIATLAGMMVALSPIAVFLCLITFSGTLIRWGFVSLSSMTASVTLPLSLIIIPYLGIGEPQPSQSLLIFSLSVPIFVFFTHRENIHRLREGKEKGFANVIIFEGKQGRNKKND